MKPTETRHSATAVIQQLLSLFREAPCNLSVRRQLEAYRNKNLWLELPEDRMIHLSAIGRILLSLVPPHWERDEEWIKARGYLQEQLSRE